MHIRALFFATYRDLAGADEIGVELPVGSSIADLVGTLRSRGGAWLGLPAKPAVALNLTYTGLGAALSDGDEVAFIPPVSGG
jgi:molybdopterin synthase sulfur carrier subunit